MAKLKRVIYLVEDTESAQFRYRCRNVCEALEKSKKWQTEWFLKSDIEKVVRVLDRASLLVIERQTAKDNVVLNLIEEAHKLGIKVLFDLDDLIFDYRDLPLLMWSTNSKNIFYWSGYFWGIRRIAKRVDGFLCTNDFLANRLKRSFQKPAKVIRNSLNTEQIKTSKKALNNKKMIKEGFQIGYFSGSPTHEKDFRLVEHELIKFLEKYKDVTLKVVGYMNFSGDMQKMIDSGRVKTLPKVDYLKLQELIAAVDVNISPLVVNDFTNCKSELKFFEAAVVETTTIASPTYAFKKVIEDGKNGFLAQHDEWYEKLEYLYKNPNKNREVALVAKDYALKHYYGNGFLKEIEIVYDCLVRKDDE